MMNPIVQTLKSHSDGIQPWVTVQEEMDSMDVLSEAETRNSNPYISQCHVLSSNLATPVIPSSNCRLNGNGSATSLEMLSTITSGRLM